MPLALSSFLGPSIYFSNIFSLIIVLSTVPVLLLYITDGIPGSDDVPQTLPREVAKSPLLR